MDARTLLIAVGGIFLFITAALGLKIVETAQESKQIATFTSFTNSYVDKLSGLSGKLYQERSMGTKFLASDDASTSSLQTQATSVDATFSEILNVLNEHPEYTENTRFNDALTNLKEAYSKHESVRQKLKSKSINNQEWFKSFNTLADKIHHFRLALFVAQDDIQEALFQNLIIKDSVSKLVRYTSLEQGYLADIIVKNSEIDESTKNTLVSTRTLAETALKDIKFFTSQKEVSPSIKEALKEMDAQLAKMQETQKKLYAAALLGFGFPMSLDDWIKESQVVLNSIIKVEQAISAPTTEKMTVLENDASSAETIIYSSAAVLALVLVVIAYLVHLKILSPLARQKVLRIEFENNVQSLIESVLKKMSSMESASASMEESGIKTTQEAQLVQGEMDNSDTNVQAVASAIHELSSSIVEISTQITHATDMINSATSEASNTQTLMNNLADASDRIGNAVGIINDIADQTNLLALNASIEAARAGDAGRGFAVVAEEVRKLAEETGEATLKISSFVQEIQGESNKANGAIETISDQINKINEIAGEVKTSITEQSTATESIATNATDASQSTETVKSSIGIMMEQLGNTSSATTVMHENVNEASKAVSDLNKMSSEFLKEIKKI